MRKLTKGKKVHLDEMTFLANVADSFCLALEEMFNRARVHSTVDYIHSNAVHFNETLNNIDIDFQLKLSWHLMC